MECTFIKCKNFILCKNNYRCPAFNQLQYNRGIEKQKSEKQEYKLQKIVITEDDIDETLRQLKKLEPTSDNPFFRLAIIGYEIGKAFSSLEHSIVYTERFKNDKKSRIAHLKNAQLELGDCFTQLQLLAETYNFDITETRKIGAQHLAERHEDFKIKGWTEIGGTK